MARKPLEDWASQLSAAEAREALALEQMMDHLSAARSIAADRLEAIKKRAYMRVRQQTKTELRKLRWRGERDAAAGQGEVREATGEDEVG